MKKKFSIMLLTIFLFGNTAYAFDVSDVVCLVLGIPTAYAPGFISYEITDSVGKSIMTFKLSSIDATEKNLKKLSDNNFEKFIIELQKAGKESRLKKEIDQGAELRLKGYSKHDEEMEEYKIQAEKRKMTLVNSSLDQYRCYNNGVAKTAAFMSSLAYNDKLRTTTELKASGFELIKFYEDNLDNQFFIAKKSGQEKYIISIRGTESGEDVLRDLNAFYSNFSGLSLKEYDVKGKVHEGFGQLAKIAYSIIQEELKQNKGELLITGHSLGGAAANILSVILQKNGEPLERIQTYTFGAPPVGDEEFFNNYESSQKIFRIRAIEDPVPYTAYLANYKHIGEVHTFENSNGTFNHYISPEESAQSYVSLMELRKDTKIGFIKIVDGTESQLIAISKKNEGLYRITSSSGSMLLDIEQLKLNPFDIFDETWQQDLIKNIQEMELGFDKLKESFEMAVNSAKSYTDGLTDQIIVITKYQYKEITSKLRLLDIATFHLFSFLGVGYDSHAHSMDGTYLNIINDFYSIVINQDCKELLDKTECNKFRANAFKTTQIQKDRVV